MFFLKFARKLGKILRGGVRSRQIMLGALLGVIIGMIPGFNLSLVIAIIALLILNAHVGVAMFGVALGKVAMYLLAPVTFQIGFILVHQLGVEGLFRVLANAPVLALLDLHVYSLTGGLPVAVLLGGIFGWVMTRMVDALRTGIIQATDRSPRMKKLANNRAVRLFMRIVFGKQKGDLEELLSRHQPVLRRSGLILVTVVVVLGAVLQLFLLDYMFERGLVAALEYANGAEVNVEHADLSPLRGRLAIDRLQVTDPADPAHNSVQADRVSADLSITELLRKNYVVDILSVKNVRTGEKRDTPGEVYEEPEDPEEPPEQVEEKTVYDYLERADTLRSYMSRAQDYLERRAEGRDMEEADEEKREERQRRRLFDATDEVGYLRLSAKLLLTERPSWTIRRMEVDGVRIPGISELQNVHADNVSSHPERLDSPMAFRMTGEPDGPSTGELELNFHRPGAMHALKLDLSDIALEDGAGMSDEVPIRLEEGTAGLRLAGEFSAERIEFPFLIDVTDFAGSAREGEKVLGMDPEVAEEVFANVDELTVVGAVEGSFRSPRVRLDVRETLKSLQDDLQGAVRKKLEDEGRRRLEEEADDALGGLLGGDDSDEEDEDGEDEEEDKSPADRIRDMF